MRLNVFQYHIQDRDYSNVEAAALINNAANKHLILADSEYSYSSGTIAETIAHVAFPVVIVAAVVGAVYLIVTADRSENKFKDDSDYEYSRGNNGNINIINSFNTNNVNSNHYKAIDLPSDKYTAREVTKFMNEYYDYPFLHILRDVRNQTIINKFINHEYIDAEVPTLGNTSFFSSDIAILDI